MSERPVLALEGLSVRVGGRSLLTGADLSVGEGEIVLIAGPSGSGKSVLLKLVSGLIHGKTPGFDVGGRLLVLGRDVLAEPGAGLGSVGLVFQDFALFDGMTAEENVSFALDHRHPPLSRDAARSLRSELLGGLSLPEHAPIGTLSGGQRQRVAIARALAFAPRILAYDEPTSGLDPALRDQVAARIRETGVTTLVVTHDLAGLIGIADRIVLLDPEERQLLEVSKEEAADRLAELRVEVLPRPKEPGVLRRGIRGLLSGLEGTAGIFEALGTSLLHLLPRWRSPRWGFRFFALYFRAVAGPGALLYFLLAGIVIGVVASYFTFNFLPYRRFTEPLILDDMVAALGFGLHRILVPLILTILLAARAGAAISADLSTRVVGRQVEAMRTLGAVPSRYLLTGVLLALLIGTPILSILAYSGARIASACVFAVMVPDRSLHAWEVMFGRLTEAPDRLFLVGTGWVAAKVLTAAFGIAAVAYATGSAPKDSPEDVARSITATVIRATAFCLVVHMVFSFIEF